MNRGYSIFIATIVCLVLSAFSQIAHNQVIEVDPKLELKLTTPKLASLLGEVTRFDFAVTNNSKETVIFRNSLDPMSGYLNIFISKNRNRDFKQYIGPGWGKSDAVFRIVSLKPDETVRESAPIFWHAKPELSVASADHVIKRVTEDLIMTNYAFPERGTYYIKASCLIHLSNRTEAILLESEPIEVTIDEPAGEDLEVWNKIKNSGDFAYFIQEGDFLIPSYKTEERAKFQRDVEQILNDHPSSFYAQSLRQSLDKFRAKEVRRQENIDKLRKEKPH
jgi:hypothetical protein